MPKTTPESEYVKYMSTLQSKIRAEEVGLQSWKGGKRVQIAPIRMGVNDLLLAGDKLIKAQKAQNQMVEEYLEKQKAPIIRYDEFGHPIGEFKYHEIPPPELEDLIFVLPAVTETLIDPRDGSEYENVVEPQRNIEIDVKDIEEVKKQAIERYNQVHSETQRDLNLEIQEIEINEQELININDEIIKARQERGERLNEIQTQYDIQKDIIKAGPKINKSKKMKQLDKGRKEEIKQFIAKNDQIIRDAELYRNYVTINIAQGKERITEIQKRKNINIEQSEIIMANIDRISTDNKKKIQAYQQQLQRMNTGPFGLDRNVDETDVEYAERLQAIANEEFPTARNEEKANQLNKEELREKLSTLFRDRSMIENIVNTLDLQSKVYSLNSQFVGFKTAFEKRYGEFNKTVKLDTILEEIDNYLDRRISGLSEDLQLVQVGRAQPSETSGRADTPPVRTIPKRGLSSSSSIPTAPPSSLLNPTSYEGAEESKDYVVDDETGFILPSSMEDIPEGEIISSSQGTILPRAISNATVLHYKNPIGNGQAFLKIAEIRKGLAKPETVVFISPTGKEGSYRSTIFTDSKKDGIHSLLEKYLGTKDYYGKYKIDPKTGDVPKDSEGRPILVNALKKDILDVFANSKIQYSDPSGLQESVEDGRKILRGLGLKMSDNVETIPTIINFGLVFLLLRKLYLNNILSIQNKHYKKVNGFNNVKVSDTFVEIIQDILNEKNYISKLSQLSSNERELFDHLLYIAGLHKQLNGGSTADYNKLKKQLEILEGEIAAGNNNILLKKKLFNLLQKMAHYKMISSHGAQKHFKQFEEYFK